MDKDEPDIGRFEGKGNPHEPREPFLPDMDNPSLSGLHIPKSPLNRAKLKAFLIELEPIIVHIQTLSREDQHQVGSHLNTMKGELHSEVFSEEVSRAFEKMTDHYNDLLMNSTPSDQKKALENLRELLKQLS